MTFFNKALSSYANLHNHFALSGPFIEWISLMQRLEQVNVFSLDPIVRLIVGP